MKALGHRLGSPASAGLQWTIDFIAACRADANCAAVQPDFVDMHMFVTDANAFMSAVVSACIPNTFVL